jgi:phage terminase small subunit
MTMGRPPKPVEAKRRTGNPGKRRLPDPVTALPAVTDGAAPRVPVGLGSPGKRMWADLWRFSQAWMSPGMDYTVAEMACRTFDEIAGHRRDIARYGRVVEEPVHFEGKLVHLEDPANPDRTSSALLVTLKPNPALASLRAAEKSLGEWLSKLGIPPADRARLGLAQVRAESKLDQLMERREARRRAAAGDGGPDPPA